MTSSRSIDSGSFNTTRRFPTRRIVVFSILFFVFLLAINRLVRVLHAFVEFDCPPYWPISQMHIHTPTVAAVAVAMLLGAAMGFSFVRLRVGSFRPISVIAVGGLLILGTNLLQVDHASDGWLAGLVRPIAGGPPYIQYYHDAQAVHDARSFLTEYETLQSGLHDHGRTHPPGAVLAFYGLSNALRRPWMIALAMAVVAVVLTGLGLTGLMRAVEGPRDAGFTMLLYFLIPSMQIYTLASLDAVIAGLAVCCAACVLGRGGTARIAAAGACLFAISGLTFAAGFIAVFLIASEWCVRGSIRRSMVIFASAAIAWLVVRLAIGFDYVHSFRIATAIENPGGFRLFADPISCLMTRLECIGDVAVFLGPVIVWLVWQGVRKSGGQSPSGRLALVAIGVFLAAIATGAFHTGETARVTLFIQPFLVLPIPAALASMHAHDRDRRLLAGLVFGQTLMMQLFGDYFW